MKELDSLKQKIVKCTDQKQLIKLLKELYELELKLSGQ